MKNIDEIIRQHEQRYRDRFAGKVVAFVHAKGSSTRVPSKNMKMLGDRPLFCHAIAHAQEASLVDAVVIDSDDEKILEIGEKYGAIPLKRPGELATNLATGDDLAYWQASNFPLSKIVLQVVPTAPFLRAVSVDRAIQILLKHPEMDSVAGVYEDALYIWEDGIPKYYNEDGTIPNSFEMKKTVYETTGLYVNYTKDVLRTGKRLNPKKCIPCVLSKLESIDINTMEDLELAETIYYGIAARHGDIAAINRGGVKQLPNNTSEILASDPFTILRISGLYAIVKLVFISYALWARLSVYYRKEEASK